MSEEPDSACRTTVKICLAEESEMRRRFVRIVYLGGREWKGVDS